MFTETFGKYLVLVILVSSSALIGQFVFQIVLLSNPNEDILPNCSFKQQILEEFGFSRFDRVDIVDIIRVVFPDFLMLSVAIVALFICKKVSNRNAELEALRLTKAPTLTRLVDTMKTTNNEAVRDHIDQAQQRRMSRNVPQNAMVTSATLTTTVAASEVAEGCSSDTDADASARLTVPSQFQSKNSLNTSTGRLNQKKAEVNRGGGGGGNRLTAPIRRFINVVLPVILQLTFLLLLFVCATVWPSLLSLFYLIVFIIIMTRWSLSIPVINTDFLRNVKMLVLAYSLLHLLVNYLYQIRMFQAALSPTDLIARLLGLNQIVYTECTHPAHYFFPDTLEWQQITYPFLLFILYYFLAVENSYTPHYRELANGQLARSRAAVAKVTSPSKSAEDKLSVRNIQVSTTEIVKEEPVDQASAEKQVRNQPVQFSTFFLTGSSERTVSWLLD